MINDRNSVYFLRYFSIWLRLPCRHSRITIHSHKCITCRIYYAHRGMQTTHFLHHIIVCIFSASPFSRLFSFSSDFVLRSFSFHFYLHLFFLFLSFSLSFFDFWSCYFTTHIWSIYLVEQHCYCYCWWSDPNSKDIYSIQLKDLYSHEYLVYAFGVQIKWNNSLWNNKICMVCLAGSCTPLIALIWKTQQHGNNILKC